MRHQSRTTLKKGTPRGFRTVPGGSPESPVVVGSGYPRPRIGGAAHSTHVSIMTDGMKGPKEPHRGEPLSTSIVVAIRLPRSTLPTIEERYQNILLSENNFPLPVAFFDH